MKPADRTTRTEQPNNKTQNRPGHTYTTLILSLCIHQMGDNAYDMHDLLNWIIPSSHCGQFV